MQFAAVAGLAAILAAAVPVAAQAQAVQRVVAVVRPQHYQGPCPAQFVFTGTIFVAYPALVTYRWERSDRAVGPVQSVTVRPAGLGVETAWQIGGPPGRVFNGYERLHVLSPVDLYSNAAAFSLACR